MQDRKRRGRRPMATTLVSERRLPGGREFVFQSTDLDAAPDARPIRALKTSRSFCWAEEVPAANDASVAPGSEAGSPDNDYARFLRGLRIVYRSDRRR